MKYEVTLFNIPKVSADGRKSIAVPESEFNMFEDLEEATRFAAEAKGKFARVVVIQTDGSKQELVERYWNGRHETPEMIVRR